MNPDSLWQGVNQVAQNVGLLNDGFTTLSDSITTLADAITDTTGYGIPAGATALAASSGNVANAVATATLTPAGIRRMYITGFDVTSTGATVAAVVTLTITNVFNTTLTYAYPTVAGATTFNEPLIVRFPFPIPAISGAVDIIVSLPALGAGNTRAAVNAYGFYV